MRPVRQRLPPHADQRIAERSLCVICFILNDKDANPFVVLQFRAQITGHREFLPRLHGNRLRPSPRVVLFTFLAKQFHATLSAFRLLIRRAGVLLQNPIVHGAFEIPRKGCMVFDDRLRRGQRFRIRDAGGLHQKFAQGVRHHLMAFRVRMRRIRHVCVRELLLAE